MRQVAKAAVTTGGAAVLAMVFSVLSGKIIAIVLGTAGIGLYGILLQLHATAVSFASFGGGGNAVVQGIASRTGVERDRFVVTTAWIHALTAAVMALLLILAAPVVPGLLGVENSSALSNDMVRALAIPLCVGVLGVFLGAVVNGYREISALAGIRVLSSATTAALAFPAAVMARGGRYVALVGLITAALVVQCAAYLFIASRKAMLSGRQLLRKDYFARDALYNFGAVAGMFFAAGQTVQIGMLMITALVVRSSGLQGAGLLNVSITISTGYIMLVLSSFATYYAPTVSAAEDAAAVKRVIGDVFRLSMLASVPVIVAIVVLKPLLILTLYTSEFLPALKVLRWILIGDYIKVFSWVFALPLSARAIMKLFLIGEVGLMVVYYLLSLLLLPIIGSPEAVGTAFMLSYAAYLAFHVYFARVHWQFAPGARDVIVWLTGLLLIVAASLAHWDRVDVRPIHAAAWILAATLFAWWALGSATRTQAIALARRRLRR